MKRIITIWYRAIFLNYWYWRVTYKNGTKTRRLSYSEAESIKRYFGGKLHIDYSVKLESKEKKISVFEKYWDRISMKLCGTQTDLFRY